jgi:hypothetical protein
MLGAFRGPPSFFMISSNGLAGSCNRSNASSKGKRSWKAGSKNRAAIQIYSMVPQWYLKSSTVSIQAVNPTKVTFSAETNTF